jgi:hypothetical protein
MKNKIEPSGKSQLNLEPLTVPLLIQKIGGKFFVIFREGIWLKSILLISLYF